MGCSQTIQDGQCLHQDLKGRKTLTVLDQDLEHSLQSRATLHCLCNPRLPSVLLAQCPTAGLWQACYKDKDDKGTYLHPEPQF